MRKLLLRLSFLLFLFQIIINNCKAQWVTIPDTGFVQYLNVTYPACMNGNQLDTTCYAVLNDTFLVCNFYNIHDLTGIKYFKNMNRLACTDNLLTVLPEFPPSLRRLTCAGNLFTTLNYIPAGLEAFFCDHCQLVSLPLIPDGIKELYLSQNQLVSLPQLPSHLTHLSVLMNNLTALPPLPATLVDLNCGRNQLTSIPEVPDSMYQLYVGYNFGLRCLPKLKKVYFLGFDSTSITCLPNFGEIGTSLPPLTNYGLCDSGNVNGCTCYSTLSGKVFFDSITDCSMNFGEKGQTNMKMLLYGQNNTLISQQLAHYNGDYGFDIDSLGSYTLIVDTTDIPLTVTCPPSGAIDLVLNNQSSSVAHQNLGLNCKPGFDLIAQSISGRFRPGGISEVFAACGDASNFFGARCAMGVAGTVQLIINPTVSYLAPAAGALSPTGISNDTITWAIDDFGTANFFSDFNVMVKTDSFAPIGSKICFTLLVSATSAENYLTNNSLTQCFTIVASFDPNEKEASPPGNIDTAQDDITYTIHFQNTGTAEAQYISIADTLHNALEPASFRLLAYSHQPQVSIRENVIRFNFPSINLPDSNTNEPASHGYVQYKVKLKPNLPVGTSISNTAFIYFDFNAPVVTNTTTNTISINTRVTEIAAADGRFSIYPNPSSGSVTVSMDESMIGGILTLTDLIGRKITAMPIRSTTEQLQLSDVSNGVYLLSAHSQGKTITRKLVLNK